MAYYKDQVKVPALELLRRIEESNAQGFEPVSGSLGNVSERKSIKGGIRYLVAKGYVVGLAPKYDPTYGTKNYTVTDEGLKLLGKPQGGQYAGLAIKEARRKEDRDAMRREAV